MPIHRTHAAAAAQSSTLHFAVKHETLVASRSAYQLGIPEVWLLTAKWKARVYHGIILVRGGKGGERRSRGGEGIENVLNRSYLN